MWEALKQGIRYFFNTKPINNMWRAIKPTDVSLLNGTGAIPLFQTHPNMMSMYITEPSGIPWMTLARCHGSHDVGETFSRNGEILLIPVSSSFLFLCRLICRRISIEFI